MATWKKIVVSGSAAQLLSLTLDSALGVAYGGTGLTSIGANNFLVGTGTTTFTTVGSNGTGNVVRTTGASLVVMSGSFSGSFVGNGTGLTGVLADSNFPIAADDGTTGTFSTATETLRFDTASNHGFGFTVVDSNPLSIRLETPQDLRAVGSPTFAGLTATQLTGSTLNLIGLSAGTTDTVLILSAGSGVQTRTADSRIWGSTLVDGSGSATRVAFWSDTNTVVSDSNFTYSSNVLTINGSTFGQNVTVAGDFTVLGNTTVLNVTNLLVEDKFILLNSGSATGDGGIIIQSGSAFNGVAFGWDESMARWGFQQTTLLTQSSSALTPEAYASAVVDVDGGLTDIAAFQKNGNIKITGGDIYIYA